MTPTLLIPIVGMMLLLVMALALLALKTTKSGSHADGYPYDKKDALFSPAERSFLGVLEQAAAEQYRVFGKVRVADVVKVKTTPNRSVWQRAFNRISNKHFDFVLCTKDDLVPVAAIELDDDSHQRDDRKARDRFLTHVCEAAALPLLQLPAPRAYSAAELRRQLQAAIEPQPQPAGEPRPAR